jgi:primosomal protein N' (replication factor Y)
LLAKEEGKQSLFFLNRRGFAPSVTCTACGETLKCADCDISLTYHKSKNALVCHFCGKVYPLPVACPSCGKRTLKLMGVGTEKLEELAKKEFPEMTVARIDLDTIQKKGELKRLLTDFEKGKTDILIGTQIIAKGLDFANVKVAAVILADIGLNLPDFKASERTFSLITQVSGRAGRRETRGEVIIQTYKPDNFAIKAGAKADYEAFYNEEIKYRKILTYPPFSDFVQVLVTSKDQSAAEEGAMHFAKELNIPFLGPSPAPVAKVSGNYRFVIYIKVPNAKKAEYYKELDKLRTEINLDTKKDYLVGIDINPYSVL